MEDGFTLKTFGDLLQHGYKLSGHCRRCSVHRDIDLNAVPADRDYVGARFKCRDCGGGVEITLSKAAIADSGHPPALDRWRER